ncbi:hypothetical protein [Novosphingobium sp.]|uniref:hypothetical protein n=1 Tax=Novosphingobium sp. TaxID=1874826 RepID=UPI0025F10C00|nr:hypothetical protein [Novosphingobium sp.]
MTDKELAAERRKQKRLEKLGTNEPRCGTCGEGRWQCIEQHHPADHGRDETTVLVCRNCHRVLSDEQRGHPAFDHDADPFLASVGHFLLGLADMLTIIFAKLSEFGLALIARSTGTEGKSA